MSGEPTKTSIVLRSTGYRSGVQCPSCAEVMDELHEGLHEDILVRRCGRCRRLWLSPQSLDRLDDNIEVDASRIEWIGTGGEAQYACTSCAGTYRTAGPELDELTLKDRADIVVHRCGTCRSFLLDPSTLEKIRGHLAGRGVPAIALLARLPTEPEFPDKDGR